MARLKPCPSSKIAAGAGCSTSSSVGEANGKSRCLRFASAASRGRRDDIRGGLWLSRMFLRWLREKSHTSGAKLAAARQFRPTYSDEWDAPAGRALAAVPFSSSQWRPFSIRWFWIGLVKILSPWPMLM